MLASVSFFRETRSLRAAPASVAPATTAVGASTPVAARPGGLGARAGGDAEDGRGLPPQQPRRAARAVLRGSGMVRGAGARERQHAPPGAGGRVRGPRL